MSQADSAYTTIPRPPYFVVMIRYEANGFEAIVDPSMDQDEVAARIVTEEYDPRRIAFIHHVHDGVVEDVTHTLFMQAYRMEPNLVEVE